MVPSLIMSTGVGGSSPRVNIVEVYCLSNRLLRHHLLHHPSSAPITLMNLVPQNCKLSITSSQVPTVTSVLTHLRSIPGRTAKALSSAVAGQLREKSTVWHERSPHLPENPRLSTFGAVS